MKAKEATVDTAGMGYLESVPRRLVTVWLPLSVFLFVLLFPFYWMLITTFRPDGELYRPWRAANYTPFWTWNPTLDHIKYLFNETVFTTWLWNTMVISTASTVISLICGVFAGYALSRLDPEEAERTLALFAQAGQPLASAGVA